VGPWSDLYALGATLCRAITGEKPPKSTDRAFDDPFVPLSERKELLERYSNGFLSCIDRALAVRPGERFQSAAEWLEALETGGAELNHRTEPERSAKRAKEAKGGGGADKGSRAFFGPSKSGEASPQSEGGFAAPQNV